MRVLNLDVGWSTSRHSCCSKRTIRLCPSFARMHLVKIAHVEYPVYARPRVYARCRTLVFYPEIVCSSVFTLMHSSRATMPDFVARWLILHHVAAFDAA